MAKDIGSIDKNLAVEKRIDENGLLFIHATKEPFYISGIVYDGKFKRMNSDIAKKVSEGVEFLHTNTAGGAVHFRTDSKKLAIKAEWDKVTKFPHMPATGVRGFDVYVNNEYYKTFNPPVDSDTGYESVIEFEECEMKNITINFPLYNDVNDLYIGVQNTAEITGYNPYIYDKPVVYYGSSITQGGCASRPGMSYEAIISRKLGISHINLGFSGSARGEEMMAEYISGIDMKVFVMDYDHNAATKEYLEKTHEKFFSIIRKANPKLPVVIVSAPTLNLPEELKRREIIENTYKNAKANRDENVYFIDGLSIFPNGDCTVDGCHPTDLGFYFMAEKIGNVIEKIIK